MNKEQSFELDLLDFHGEALELSFEAPAEAATWLFDGVDVPVRLDEDGAFRTELRAQLIGSTVYLDGSISGDFHLKCGRCLQWRPFELDEEVAFVLMSRASWEDRYEGNDEIALDEADLDVSYYDGEILDLRPLLREALLLEVPGFPLCPESLREACDRDYEAVVGEEKLAENEANSIDLRWAKLRDIQLDDGD